MRKRKIKKKKVLFFVPVMTYSTRKNNAVNVIGQKFSSNWYIKLKQMKTTKLYPKILTAANPGRNNLISGWSQSS